MPEAASPFHPDLLDDLPTGLLCFDLPVPEASVGALRWANRLAHSWLGPTLPLAGDSRAVSQPEFFHALTESLRTGHPVPDGLLTGNGRWLRGRASVSGGAVWVVLDDVTDLKNAEALLERQARLLDVIFDQDILGMVVFVPEGGPEDAPTDYRVERTNPYFLQLTRHPGPTGGSLRALLTPDQAQALAACLAKAIASQTGVHFSGNLGTHWVEAVAIPKGRKVVFLCRDSTAAHRQQQETNALYARFQQAHDLLESVFMASPAGMVLYRPVRDGAGRVVDFIYELTNPTNARIVNRPFEELQGGRLLEMFETVRETGFFDLLREILATGAEKSFPWHHDADGFRVFVEANLRRVGDAVLFTFLDVTPLVEQRQELEKARRAAEDALAVRDSFLANISHELRTPLNAIVGFTELLGEKVTTPEKAGYVRNIQTASRNLLQLINSLLDLAKVESGQLDIGREPTYLAELVESVASLMSVQAAKKQLRFAMHLDPALPRCVDSDTLRLTQVLINLCSNAVKFTASGSVSLTARIEARREDEVDVEFTVLDTGVGIPAEKIGHIFDRFVQVSAANHYGGTGLGLNIVRNLVERMGGHIAVESAVGVGTAMRVRMAFRVLKNAPESAAEPAAEAGVPPARTLSADLDLLVVEDNPFNQKLVLGMLQSYAIKPRLANNGVEALVEVRRKRPDLILMDVQMPYMDGLRTTRHLRHSLRTNVPVVAMTANAMASEKAACLDAGMNDYLSKPFTKNQLLAQLTRWSGAIPPPLPAAQEDDDSLLDAHSFRQNFEETEDLLPEFLAAILKEWPAVVRLLSEFIETRQAGAFHKEAHRFRSTLLSLSMYPAAEALRALELRGDEADWHDLAHDFGLFADLTERSISAFQRRAALSA